MWTSTESSQTIPALDRNPHQREFFPSKTEAAVPSRDAAGANFVLKFLFQFEPENIEVVFHLFRLCGLELGHGRDKTLSLSLGYILRERGRVAVLDSSKKGCSLKEKRKKRERERGRL